MVTHRSTVDLTELPCGWVRFDDEGRILAHNRQLGAWLGRSPEALVGTLLSEHLDGASRLIFCAGLLPSLKVNGCIDESYLGLRPGSGPVMTVLAHIERTCADAHTDADTDADTDAAMHDDGTSAPAATAMSTAVLLPTRERQQVLMELHRARRSLSLAPCAVFHCERRVDGGIGFIYVSERLLDLVGVTPAQARQSAQVVFQRFEPADRNALFARLADAEAQVTTWTGVLRLSQPDGQGRWIEWQADPEPGEHGSLAWHGVLSDVSGRERLRLQLQEQAHTDELTRLPNRHGLLRRLNECIARAQARRTSFAVLFIDLDRFKQVNDSLGHNAGDELLRLIAERLRSALRPGDAFARRTDDHAAAPPAPHTAARLGGDEFIVLLEGVADGETARSVAARLIHQLSLPYRVGEHDVSSGASVGIVVSDGTDCPESLLRDADIAMYEAKRRGRGGTVVFTRDMHTRVVQAMSTEADLRIALTHGQLRAVFQPIVRLGDGALVGVEALARWRHPQRGEVSPAAFIPVAEDSGLIGALGDQVLDLACSAYVAWRDAGVRVPPRLSVNLSRAQLRDPQLIDRVRAVLERTGMPCSALQLEITETLAMQGDDSMAVLNALRSLGITLALDDFGTGWSSLACLHQLPVQQIKIDRSFTREVESSAYHRALVEATVHVAQALSLQVVAEGVETTSQAACLLALGCRLGQGYLYARPLETTDFAGFADGCPTP